MTVEVWIAVAALVLAAAQVLFAWLQLRQGVKRKEGLSQVPAGDRKVPTGGSRPKESTREPDDDLLEVHLTARLGGSFALVGGLVGLILAAKATFSTLTVAALLVVTALTPVIVTMARNGGRQYELVAPAIVLASALVAALLWGPWMFYVGGAVTWLALAGFPHRTDKYFYSGMLSLGGASAYLVTFLWGPVPMFLAFVGVTITAGAIAWNLMW